MDEPIRDLGPGGRYRPEVLLGEGAMGKVLLARDQELDRRVELKIIPPQLLDRPVLRARFEREARIQASIEHPHVVRVYDCQLDLPEPFLVMEYVDGTDLEKVLKAEERLRPDRVVRVARELGAALDLLHEKGVIHRDIKPSNVMIRREDGGALLMDLGLASQQDAQELTRTGQVIGTPRYFPPEILSGEGWSAAGDRFQLAAVLFEAMTGESYLPGDTLESLVQCALLGRFRDFPEDLAVAPEVQEVLRRGAAFEPGERHETAGALAEELAQAVGVVDTGAQPAVPPGGRPSPAPPPSSDRSMIVGVFDPSASQPGAGGGRLPAPVLLGAAGAVMVVLLLVWGLGGRAEPQDVQWRVIGDALVVDADPAGARGLRLWVDDRLVTPAPFPSGERVRFVFRSLPESQDAPAELRWQGGHGPRAGYRARPLALTPHADLRLGDGPSLEVEVLRPVEVAYRGRPGRRYLLREGRDSLPLPADGELCLVWQEEGIDFERCYGWDEVLRGRLRDLYRTLDEVELPRRLGLEYLAGSAIDTGRAVEAWRELADWIPTLLASGLAPSELRRFWSSWDDWDRSMAALRYLSTNQDEVEVPEGALGDKLWELPRWREAGRTMADLFLADGSPVGARPPDLSSWDWRDHQDRRYPEAETELFFLWPAEVPNRDHDVFVWVETGRLKQGCLFRLEAEPEHPGTPRFELELWHGRIRFGSGDRYTGPIGAVLPAAMLPEAGTRNRVVIENFLIDKDTHAVLRGVGVMWRAREELPIPGRGGSE